MRNALTALLLTAPAVLSLPKPFPAATPRNYGSWDISTTYMNVPSSAFWRNVTAVYTNSEESLHLITECKQQGGPGNEEINECDNADFKWTLEGDADIQVSQKVQFSDGVKDLVGAGTLDVTCATQRACWGSGTVKAYPA
ncbi:hypothetical protein BU26DRAFT_519991 [Trematosphaeria pertusa]|uniref:AA1-like domain-containing protein n=1 Tax=Trematosphaeria pertusa TaxID=390896 RepID=A0A6A6ID01_9PLEO|nr:uncharacterized protein BU26DRAFT_519991 [Trematosphaeria pertusa]KAF2248271.1 hypothetical protein BU26DRAFT_519991 [Trematosphaeria pertusa]